MKFDFGSTAIGCGLGAAATAVFFVLTIRANSEHNAKVDQDRDAMMASAMELATKRLSECTAIIERQKEASK